MTNAQLYLAIGVPLVVNTALVLLVYASLTTTIDLTATALRGEMAQQFLAVGHRFEAINQRFDDMRHLWLTELHRVEEVIDARLQHLEERER